MDKAYQKARILIEALPYFQSFDEKIVVVKLGGNAINESTLLEDTLQDIVFMEQVGIRPVLVHGGGPYISKRLEEAGASTEFINGLRVTDELTLKVVQEVYQEINEDICATIRKKGGQAESIYGAKDGIFMAKKKSFEDQPNIDLGFVGDVTQAAPLRIIEMTRKGIVPVISPSAKGEDTHAYNVNADTAAAKLAESLKAEKLVFMSNIKGLLKDPNDQKSLISSLFPEEVQALIDDSTIQGGMLPKVAASLHALQCGVQKVHIVDGRLHHSLLLEIFTQDGVGTQFINH